MELIQGCRNSAEQATVERRLLGYALAWLEPEGCDAAFRLYARYHLSHGLGLLDSLIAQVALSLDLPLNTFNQKHYAVIPGLRLIQPYAKTGA